MDLAFVQELVNYHYWANDRILKAVESLPAEAYHQELGNSFSSIAATLAHLMYAEAVWLSRWTGETIPAPTPDEVASPAAARERWRSLEERFRRFVAGLEAGDLERVHTMRNTAGKEFQHPLREMLLQVLNHGTYHRGQVVTMLRQVGAGAVSTDLILYYRKQSGQV